jgi:serine/threonine protein kinase
MPYYSQLIPVNIPEDRARSYFKQLTSAVAYLHDKGISGWRLRMSL